MELRNNLRGKWCAQGKLRITPAAVGCGTRRDFWDLWAAQWLRRGGAEQKSPFFLALLGSFGARRLDLSMFFETWETCRGSNSKGVDGRYE